MKPSQAKPRRAVFLDRDGTINEEVHYLGRPEDVRLIPGAGEAIARLNQAGFQVVVVTNQSGLARGMFDEAALAEVRAELDRQLAEEGAKVEAHYACPHLPEGAVAKYARVCGCRKPKPGLILRAAAEMGLDLAGSYMVGDSLRDVEAGNAAGVTSILVETGHMTPPPSRPEETPDHVAMDLAAAVEWILGRLEKDAAS